MVSFEFAISSSMYLSDDKWKYENSQKLENGRSNQNIYFYLGNPKDLEQWNKISIQYC